MQIQCPHCRFVLPVDPDQAGVIGVCPACAGKFRIPAVKAVEQARPPEAVEKAKADQSAAEAKLADATKAATEAAAAEAAKTQEAFAAAQAAWDAEKESDVAAATARAGERATEPISVFVSKKTGRVQIRQAWRTIHDAPATFRDADAALGTHVYVATEMVEDGKAMRWLVARRSSLIRSSSLRSMR